MNGQQNINPFAMKKIMLPIFISILSIQLYALTVDGLVCDSVCYYAWDPDQNLWADSAKQIFKYDENLNLAESSSWLWNSETGEWVGKEGLGRQTWKYNEFGDLIETLKYHWNVMTAEWILAGGSRKEITYDNNGKIILEIFSDYHSDLGKWISSKKTEYLFNADDKLIEKSCYIWNNELMEWEGDNSSFRQAWTYNNTGDKECHIYYSWNPVIKDWEAFSKFEYNYDQKGKIIEKIQWKWDADAMNWTGIMRYTWEYYLSPCITEVIQYNWVSDLSTWFPVKLEARLYNEDGQITAYAEYAWDNLCSDWKYHGQAYTCIYDYNGNILEKTVYQWDGIQDLYIQFSCWKYSYDKFDNLTDSCFFYWDAGTESWIGQGSKVCTYDEDGNPTQILYYHWDNVNKCWNYYRIEKSYYDEYGKRTDWQRYTWDTISNEWTGSCPECINIANNPCFMIVDECGRTTYNTELESDLIGRREIKTEIHYKWNFENKDWDFSWKKVEYWSEPMPDLIDKYTLKTEGCTIFPNPFNEYACIVLPDFETAGKIELIDTYGRTVRIIHFTSGSPIRIDRDDLPEGIYFIRIHSNDIYIEKVIIQ